MTEKCRTMRELILFENFDNNWTTYQNYLYEVFKKDFIETYPFFNSKRVNIRKHPLEEGREEAFYHVTCHDFLKKRDRSPDFRRCERIRWIRSFIENHRCAKNCQECEGIKVWEQETRQKIRTYLFLEEERYVVILERRPNYYLLITAFYIEYKHALEKMRKNHVNFRKAEDAL